MVSWTEDPELDEVSATRLQEFRDAREEAARSDAKTRIRRANEALLRVQSKTDAKNTLGHVRAAIAELEALLAYEEQGIVPIRPKPSVLLRVLAEKESQLLEEEGRQAASLALAETRREAGGTSISGTEVDSGSVSRRLEERAITAAELGPGSLDSNEWLSGSEDDPWIEEYLYRPSLERSGKRRNHRGVVNCNVQVAPGGIRGIARDISAGGLFLSTYTPFPQGVGSSVRLTLSTSRGAIQTEGSVRWVERSPGGDPHQSRVGMGVEFKSTSRELMNYVQSEVLTSSI
jgi:hypothetical protein